MHVIRPNNNNNNNNLVYTCTQTESEGQAVPVEPMTKQTPDDNEILYIQVAQLSLTNLRIVLHHD